MVLVADEEVAHHERLEAKTRGGCAALPVKSARGCLLLPYFGFVAQRLAPRELSVLRRKFDGRKDY